MVNEDQKTKTVRDLDFRTDFDQNGVLTNPEMIAHYADEREKLLAPPVGSVGVVQGYLDEPPVVEKADADAKVELQSGDTPDVLIRRYSKPQLVEFAKANGVDFKGNDSAFTIAEKVLSAGIIVGDTSLTVPPAASDLLDTDEQKKS